MNRKEIKEWLYENEYLFKEGTQDMQTICGTKLYHVELLEFFQSALLKALNSEYKPIPTGSQSCANCKVRTENCDLISTCIAKNFLYWQQA